MLTFDISIHISNAPFQALYCNLERFIQFQTSTGLKDCITWIPVSDSIKHNWSCPPVPCVIQETS